MTTHRPVKQHFQFDNGVHLVWDRVRFLTAHGGDADSKAAALNRVRALAALAKDRSRDELISTLIDNEHLLTEGPIDAIESKQGQATVRESLHLIVFVHGIVSDNPNFEIG